MGGSWTRPYGGYRSDCVVLVGAGPRPARQDLHRERWLGKARRRSGTAPVLIFANPGPSGPGGIAEATQILRAGNDAQPPRRASPRNGVRGKATMSTKCSSGAVPGGVLVPLPPWAKELAARRRRNSPAQNHRGGASRRPRPTEERKAFRTGGHMGPPLQRKAKSRTDL